MCLVSDADHHEMKAQGGTNDILPQLSKNVVYMFAVSVMMCAFPY